MSGAVDIAEPAWAAAVAALRGAGEVVLICHVAPDGDALGSMLALARVLRGRGSRVRCTWGDERFVVPASYRWLPGIDEVLAPSVVLAGPAPDVVVVLDTASRERLGVLAPVADAAPALVVVDHHAHNSGLGGTHLVDASAAATATVVEELVGRLGAELDPDTATCLYTGLVTDTGSFRHAVTTPAVHAVAARLLGAGVRPDAVADRLWGRRSFGSLGLLGAALARIRLEPDALGGLGLVWTWTHADDLAAWGVGIDEAESVIDVVRLAEEADVAVVCKGDVDATFKVSLRSRGRVDVGAAAVALGGGGHRLAAGFTSADDVDTTLARVRAALAP